MHGHQPNSRFSDHQHVAILAVREPMHNPVHKRSVNGNPPEASATSHSPWGLPDREDGHISPSNHAAPPLQEMKSSTCLHATNHPGPTLQLRLSPNDALDPAEFCA